MKSVRVSVLFAVVFGAALIGLLVVEREAVSRFVWHKTHLFPEYTLVISGDAQFGMEMGRYYLGIGDDPSVYDIEKADRLFMRALQLDGTVHKGWYERAHIAFLYDHHERAIEYLGRQIALTGESVPESYYLLGLARGFNGDIEGSIEAFTTYLHSTPQADWFVHNNIAWAYFQLGLFEKAEEAATAGLEIDADNPWLLMSAGMSAYNLGRLDLARERLETAENEAAMLTVEDWLRVYPKNDPKIALLGLAELQDTIHTNLALLHASSTDE